MSVPLAGSPTIASTQQTSRGLLHKARMLEVTGLNEREVGAWICSTVRAPLPRVGRQVLHREPVTADARLAAHLARLDGVRWKPSMPSNL
jgi:hypothetical protein